MVKDQEEKAQKPPDLPTICTKKSTPSVAPTLVMTESINGRLTAFCFADVRRQSKNNEFLQEAATNSKSRSFPILRNPSLPPGLRDLLMNHSNHTSSIAISTNRLCHIQTNQGTAAPPPPATPAAPDSHTSTVVHPYLSHSKGSEPTIT
jgi:hypothetical protein